MGIEADLTRATPEELGELTDWVAFHKEHRDLLHGGTLVNADHPDDAVLVHGVVAPGRERALYSVAAVVRRATTGPGMVRLPGLDPERRYRASVPSPGRRRALDGRAAPTWAETGVALPGRVLAERGLPMLPLPPEHSHLVLVEEVASGRP